MTNPQLIAAQGLKTPEYQSKAARRLPVPPTVALSIIFLVLLAAATLRPTLFTDRSPISNQLDQSLQPPSAEHFFGTDRLGRDIFTRIIYGAEQSLTVGLFSTAIAVVIGAGIALLAVLGGRYADEVLMRFVDVLLAFPTILMALLVVAIAGGGTTNIIIALAIATVPTYARLVRSKALEVRRSAYVEAATVLGVPRWKIAVQTVVPNSIGPLLVIATIGVGTTIVDAAALSFLGFGAPEPAPEWGAMLSQGQNDLALGWWVGVFPGLFITLTVIAVTVLGRWLQKKFEGRDS
ncbi:ABC transporter permease [Nesterenkonia alkaliphila]|uniref:ABC transporter permease subunit n=1 Tax=Nesterenkonia alkaliphila TaxID=1463631 RepID=A0A7K1UL81_9MICC|nr:ABC transporter permease [Nesterenkonia alkaliphila]MVT27230.1 ABC transporter permease subunit [Nesterenkonia alkaliphila]GFZ78425.1 peptide ABC transporter permease [Nesterenkonia alkaliphila]